MNRGEMLYLLEGHPLGIQVLRAQLDLEVLGGGVRLADVDGEPLLLPLAAPACMLQDDSAQGTHLFVSRMGQHVA